MRTLAAIIISMIGMNAMASETKLKVYYRDELPQTIAWGSEGELRYDDKRIAAIADLNRNNVVGHCFEGNVKLAANMIKGLIENSNGDGDSFTETKNFTTSMSRISAKVLIENASGGDESTFTFSRCR